MRTHIAIDEPLMAEVMAIGRFKPWREAVDIGGAENALAAAALARRWRPRGCAIGAPIDVGLASCCISDGPLHSHADVGTIRSLENPDTWPH